MRLFHCMRQVYVPVCKPAQLSHVEQLQEMLATSNKLLVLTGAGISTESGIPDYRSEGVGLYARTPLRPMKHNEFVTKSASRRKYWARNFVAWPQFATFQPNVSHHKLVEWEKKGKIHWLVTQNVDSLHHKAGSERVTELHGSSHRVSCLSCPSVIDRWELQTQLEQCNPDWTLPQSVELAPDGDVLLTDEQVHAFKVPSCQSCGGILKPDVTFFGDNVSRPVVDFIFNKVHECDSMLVIGSSLSVYSGYRFILRAAELEKRITILNIGQTRADHLADLRVDARCGEVLPQLLVT